MQWTHVVIIRWQCSLLPTFVNYICFALIAVSFEPLRTKLKSSVSRNTSRRDGQVFRFGLIADVQA